MSRCTHVAGAGSRGTTIAPKYVSTLRAVPRRGPPWVHLILGLEQSRVIIMSFMVFNSVDSKYSGDAEGTARCTHVASAGSRGKTTAPKYVSTLRAVPRRGPPWVHLILGLEQSRVIITAFIVFNSVDSKYSRDTEGTARCTHVASAGSRGKTTAPKYVRHCVLCPDADHPGFT